jgi:hypothetical protein
MAQYDGEVIEEYARRLYDRVAWVIVTTTFVYAGAAFLAVLAWVKLVEYAGAGRVGQLESPVTWYILAAAVGALLGALRGNSKAFNRKLEAQRALCLVQIERNTRQKSDEPDAGITPPKT